MPSLPETVSRSVTFFGSSAHADKIQLIRPTIDYTKEHPRDVGHIFYDYYQTIKNGFAMSYPDYQTIQTVNKETNNPTGWDAFLATFGEHSELIVETIRHAGELNQPDKQGLKDLSKRMQTAQKYHQEDPRWKPNDGEKKKSDKVIWGYLNGANEPTTDISFTVAHGIERILTQKLKRISELRNQVRHKDWFVHPLTDIIILQGVKGHEPEQTLLDVWSKPRPEGLGWASQDRINRYKELHYKRTFGDNTLVGDNGDNFFNQSIQEQIRSVGFSEACPIVGQVIKRYGTTLENARDRYAEIVFTRSLLLDTVHQINEPLYQQLVKPVPRNANEPIGVHERTAVPKQAANEISPNNTPWGYSLPRVLLDQFGTREQRTDKRVLKGLTLLETSAKKAKTPLEFLAVLTNNVAHADADIDTILHSVVSKGKLGEDTVYTLYQKLLSELKIHAPKVWDRYQELTPEERLKRGIANI